MKRIRKFLLCFLLIFNFFSLTVFAEGPYSSNTGSDNSQDSLLINKNEQGSGSPGNNTYYGSMEMTGDMVLELVTTKGIAICDAFSFIKFQPLF